MLAKRILLINEEENLFFTNNNEIVNMKMAMFLSLLMIGCVFEAPLHQDMVHYHISNVLGHAKIIIKNVNKVKREISGKAVKDIQLSVIVIGSFISSFYAS